MKTDCELPAKQDFAQLMDTNQQAITAALGICKTCNDVREASLALRNLDNNGW